MMEKAIVLVILAESLLAPGNTAIVYQRSYYLESKDRINLERLIDNIEQLNHDRLLDLTNRLVTISKSDFGILVFWYFAIVKPGVSSRASMARPQPLIAATLWTFPAGKGLSA